MGTRLPIFGGTPRSIPRLNGVCVFVHTLTEQPGALSNLGEDHSLKELCTPSAGSVRQIPPGFESPAIYPPHLYPNQDNPYFSNAGAHNFARAPRPSFPVIEPSRPMVLWHHITTGNPAFPKNQGSLVPFQASKCTVVG